MKTLCQIASWLSFAGLLVVPVVFLGGGLSLGTLKVWMLVLTIVWFASVPFWMDRKSP